MIYTPFIYIFIFLTGFFFISRFLGKVHILLLPFFFASTSIIYLYYSYQDFFIPVLLGAIFFYFLGILVDRYKLEFFIEFLFQILIIASVVFLGLKIYFIRSFGEGFYYFGELSAIFFTFFWFFININALRIISKKGDFFCGIGLCITLTLTALTSAQSGAVEILLLAYTTIMMYLWVFIYVIFFRKKAYNHSVFYLMSFLTVSLSIIGTAKSVLVLSVLVPAFILGIPLLFMLIMTFISFLRFLKGHSGKIFWKFSYKRMVLFLFLTAFYLNIIVLLLFSREPFGFKWLIIIGILSFFILYYAACTLFLTKENTKSNSNIFGVDIKPITNRDLIRKTDIIFNQQNPAFIVTLNALMLYEAYLDEFYKMILNSADIQIVDGVGALWALDFLGSSKVDKFSGIDYMSLLLKMASKRNKKIYLLGTKENILLKAVNNIKNDYGKKIIAGYHNGFFTSEEEEHIIKDIKESGADILFVGMGIPKQEKWIFYNLHKLHGVKIAIGIGGAIDVYAGQLKRAPLWVQKSGMEWFYRFTNEPFRLSRILKLPAFVINVLKERIK
ncbi:MAG: WecB/TagA/CpsF family glycosyltransferase [Candidatus Muiribacteriota bacterium]